MPGGTPRPGHPQPRQGNRPTLIALGVAVIVACVVVLFALDGGGSETAPLQAGDCIPADSDAAVRCDGDDAAYRVLEAREDVPESQAPEVCAEVPGVVAYGWQGPAGGPGTALCLGSV